MKNNKNDMLQPVMVKTEAHININSRSTTDLGKRLCYSYPFAIKTICGPAGSIRNFIDFLCKEGYPAELLPKTRMTKDDILRVPKLPKRVNNYLAILAYILTQRILQDKRLQVSMKSNTLPYTSYRETRKETLFNSVIELSIPDVKMWKYVFVVNKIDELVKADNFNKATANALVESCMKDPTSKLFKGTNIENLVNDEK